MNRILRSAALIVMCVVALAAAAQHTITLGYCNNQIADDDYRITTKYECSVMGAIRITGAQLAALKGKNARITKIRVGANGSMKSTYVWVRPSLESAAVALQRMGTTAEGWNEVSLKNPYTITGDEIYIGFNATLPKNEAIILNGANNCNGAFVATQGSWDDFSRLEHGSLLIQAVVEADTDLPTHDLGIEAIDMDTQYARNGERRKFSVRIGNYGTEQEYIPSMSYQVGDGEIQQLPDVDCSIKPGNNITRTFEAEISGMEEGKNTVRVWIGEGEGGDDCADNNTLATQICVYNTAFTHKMLLEQFTTLACPNCPYGDRVLNALASNRKGVVWVAHHVGFNTDQFTVSPSEDVMEYGINSAPRAMFDRSMVSVSENGKPSFGIGYDLDLGVKTLSTPLDEVLARPAFVSVGIDADFDAQSRQLKLNVAGERNKLFSQLYDNSSLTVYLVEDSLTSKFPQSGGEPSDTIFNHVLRDALTAPLGDAIEWSGDSYQRQFTTTLPETWNIDNMKVVAFVHRPITDGLSHSEVLNTECLPLAGGHTSGIAAIDNGNDKATTRKYFNLQGQQLDADRLPAHGVYIERTYTTSGVRSVKHVEK